MLDRGFLLSGAAVLVVLLLFGRTRRHDEPALSDVAFAPALLGLLVGRLVALGLNDAPALRSMRNLLLLRGGVELWPGVAVGTAAALIAGRAGGRPLNATARLLVPSAVAAWATYDLACLIRDGCPGPASPLGLRPAGLSTTQFPVSVLAGLAGLAGAVALLRVRSRLSAPWLTVGALLLVSGLRVAESIWLPSLTGGFTRQRSQSLFVFLGSTTAFAVLGIHHLLASHRAGVASRPDPEQRQPI